MTELPKSAWLRPLLAVLILAILSPSAVPSLLVDPINTAREAVLEGRSEVALRAFEQALSFEPGLTYLHLHAAQAGFQAGQHERALEHLSIAVSHDVAGAENVCWKSEALVGVSDPEGALRAWTKTRGECPDATQILEQIADDLVLAGEQELARTALRELIALRPENPAFKTKYAMFMATWRPLQAIGALRDADATGASPLFLGDLIAAIESSQAENSQAYTLTKVGEQLIQSGEWEAAGISFGNAIALQPDYAEAHAFLGLAIDRSGGDGLEHLQRAISLAPDDPRPQVFLAMHWLQAGNPDGAISELEAALELQAENPALMAQLAAAYSALGDLDSAQAAYRRAAELDPEQSPFWLLLAQFTLLHHVNLGDVALPAARNALILDPQSPAALDAIGYAHYLSGNLLLAEQFLLGAIEADPLRVETQYHLGLLHLAMDDPVRASAAFRLAVELDPGGSFADLAERALVGISP